jgi:hypothetical protein
MSSLPRGTAGAFAVLFLAAQPYEPSELVGVWRGTSTCTDRVAAPACNDEVVVYEFTAGDKPSRVHWKAEKVVNGRKELMGELDLEYQASEACWKAEFSSPRVRGAWCLVVAGKHLTGTGRLLPGKQTVRRVDAVKD